jgi:hypothetical protein
MQSHQFEQHSYGMAGLVRVLLVALGVLPLLGIVALIDMRVGALGSGSGDSPIIVLGLIGILVLFLIGWLALLNMFPAVQTSPSGMRIQTFWFWWVFISWEDIVALYRWRTVGKRVVIVVTETLTPFHIVYGIIYAEKLKPAFLISASITRYDDLIRTIKERTGKELSL